VQISTGSLVWRRQAALAGRARVAARARVSEREGAALAELWVCHARLVCGPRATTRVEFASRRVPQGNGPAQPPASSKSICAPPLLCSAQAPALWDTMPLFSAWC